MAGDQISKRAADDRPGGTRSPIPPEGEGDSQLVSTKLERIAALVKQHPERAFHSLAHHIDKAWLYTAFFRTKRHAAPGIDDQTSDEYGRELSQNLDSLLDRFHSGRYRAPAVRRVHIPKGDGKETRPIGIPTFEDKVLQRAVAMVLEAVYERDFLPCSYGFRPGRSAHDALRELWKQTMRMGGCWLVDADIRKCFDTIDHHHLRELLQRRVRDGVILRQIGKWLNAGVLEGRELSYPERGTPQGGVISPLLANLYLHYVLDEWFEHEVKPQLYGQAFLIRYADDFVMGFANERDARWVLERLPLRFAQYGLTIHPTKTRLVDFRHPMARRDNERPQRPHRPETFNLLGFTHYWGRSWRRKGQWVVIRRTMRERLNRGLKAINDWCRVHRHDPQEDQHRKLSMKLRGHLAYYGVVNNTPSLNRFRWRVERIWHKWLNRRSHAARLTWAAFDAYLRVHPLPQVRAVLWI